MPNLLRTYVLATVTAGIVGFVLVVTGTGITLVPAAYADGDGGDEGGGDEGGGDDSSGYDSGDYDSGGDDSSGDDSSDYDSGDYDSGDYDSSGDDSGSTAENDDARDEPETRRNMRQNQAVRQSDEPRVTPRPAVQRRSFAEAEIVSIGLHEDDLSALMQRGYRVIERHHIPSINATSIRLRVPEGIGLEAARAEVQGLRPGAVTDFNHFFRSEAGPEEKQGDKPGEKCVGQYCMQFALIRITSDHDLRTACGVGSLIGIIDTGINPDHETFAHSRLEVASGIPDGLQASGAQHGTAVAALLIGDPNGRSPGLLPSARVLAIDAFHRVGRDERSDVFSLVRAMDQMANEGVRVINMSLAGPSSALIERMVEILYERGIVIVAAAGNAGPNADPVYPAAYRQVIAVTAIDRHAQVYRRAVRGPHIDFAAPGVGVWTAASISGARHKTGTSFAVPFVSAAAAVLIARNPDMSPADVARQLADNTRDLGDEGFDETYGHGLIQLHDLCQ